MKISRFKLILCCVAAVFFLAGCGGRTATRTVGTSADVVKLGGSGNTSPVVVSAEVPISISIEPGYHINANPATFDYLIATELTVDKLEGITFGKPVYPAAEKRKFQFAEEPLAVYEGNVQIKLPLQAAANAAKGTRSLTLRLRVQACDEEKCFPPDTLQATTAVDLK